jgi:hypothetical protein
MDTRQFVRAGISSIVLLGLAVLGPAPASAAMSSQQVILLIHVALGSGTFFTTNHVITGATGAVTVNVKCFNDSSQRIGPALGVNVELSATGQLSQQTPTTLGVTLDPLFTGLGWCWANNLGSSNEFSVLTTIGSTTDLTPGGLLRSAGSSLVGANTGLAVMSINRGSIPYFNTSGGAAATYVFLLNPESTARNVTLQLYNATGTAQGPPLVRALAGRNMDLLSIPDVFGRVASPVSGSVSITAQGLGYLGWIVQVGGGTILFTAIGLDEIDRAPLQPGSAP